MDYALKDSGVGDFVVDDSTFPFTMLACSTGAKKFVSATAVADWGNSQALVAPAGRSGGAAFELGAVRLVNRSGSNAFAGIGVRYDNAYWVAGQVTAAGVYTDTTPAAQDATTGDFLLWQIALPTGNGFLVGASERFNTDRKSVV